MNHASYYEKLRRSLDSDTTRSDILLALEGLNGEEWRELIRDLIGDSATVRILFDVPAGEDVIPSAAAYLRSLGEPTQWRIAQALEVVVRHARLYVTDPVQEGILRAGLSIAGVLRRGVSAATLEEMIRATDLPSAIRVHAARVLSGYFQPSPLRFWESLDFRTEPELAAPVMTALARVHPISAVDMLHHMNAPPADLSTLEYPLRFAVRACIATSAGRAALRAVMDRAPSWNRNLLKNILSFEEFREHREKYPELQSVDVQAFQSRELPLDRGVAAMLRASESLHLALRHLNEVPRFEISRVLHEGNEVSIAVTGSSRRLSIGDMLAVIDDTADGITLGEFEVTEAQTDVCRARAIDMDPVWAGHVKAAEQGAILPPATAVAILMPEGFTNHG